MVLFETDGIKVFGTELIKGASWGADGMYEGTGEDGTWKLGLELEFEVEFELNGASWGVTWTEGGMYEGTWEDELIKGASWG